MKKYFIKEGYNHRLKYHHYDDTKEEDFYQDAVYEKAKDVLKEKGYNKVIDIGCGSGFKLIKYFEKNETIGLELKQNIDFLNKKYPNRNWIESNFDSELKGEYDLIICSDVVEHLVDPDQLFNFINKINYKHLVISTPERDVVRGTHDMGPPKNLAHIREWNKKEFSDYVSTFITIEDHLLSPGNKVTKEKGNQIIIGIKK